MKKKILVVVVACLMMSWLSACSDAPQGKAKKMKLETFNSKVSYILGTDIGSSLLETGTELELEALYRGIEDSLNDREKLLNDEQIEALKVEFTQKLRQEYEEKTRVAGQKNLADGEAFLIANKGKDGVVTTASGLQYKVLVEGDGPLPGATDRVSVNYRGTLIDGKEFDSSYQRQEPVAFQLDSVIPGWVEALQMMKVGSKYQLFIPPALAYGEREAGPDIGPNSTLIFEVELLGIEK